MSNGSSAFDPSISLGNVISIVSMVVMVALAWANLSSGQSATNATLQDIKQKMVVYDRDHDTLIDLLGRIEGNVTLPSDKKSQ